MFVSDRKNLYILVSQKRHFINYDKASFIHKTITLLSTVLALYDKFFKICLNFVKIAHKIEAQLYYINEKYENGLCVSKIFIFR